METLGLGIIFSAFIAGLLTFLAPCTLPLVPAYLGFISGVSTKDLENKETAKAAKRKVFLNGVFFIFGFSLVFVIFGTLAGVVGQGLAPFRSILTTVGGIFVTIFGLFMLGVFNISLLRVEKRMKTPSFLKVGKPSSSVVIGGAFAFGWTPCVGPILGSILLLASTEGSALQGALLLAIFSLGLAIPFLLIALGFAHATERINNFFGFISRYRVVILALFGFLLGFILDLVLVGLLQKAGVYANELLTSGYTAFILPALSALSLGLLARTREKMDVLSVGGGLFLVALGILLATGNFTLLVQYGFQLLGFLEYEVLLDYL